MTATRGRLPGRVALVTGASRGQGRSHAIRLAREGADVIATDLLEGGDVAGFADIAAAVERCGRRIVVSSADVRDEDELRAVVDAGVAELGRLDVVVANAGVVSHSPSLEATAESWRLALDVNVTGVWHTCRVALPHLLDGGRGGSIVITGSTQAFRATPRVAAYATSKHGTVGLMKALAVEFAEHMIRVNSVHPTVVRSPMLKEISPAGMSDAQLREHFGALHALPVPWVEPEDVSDAVAFLASDEARYITGVALPVDAGALLVGARRS